MDYFFDFIENNIWVAEILIVLFLTLVIAAIQAMVLGGLHKKLQKTDNFWDNAIIWAINKPLNLLIWIIGLAFSFEILNKVYDNHMFALIDPLRNVGVVASIAWFLVRFINRASMFMLEKEEADKTTINTSAKLLRIAAFIIAALVILQTLGFSISGVLAFGGIGGIAIGFAAKDLLSNFFGGLIIYLDRPFKEGDWIRSPDREIEGTVEKIGWRLTVIRTFDKRPLYVPNAIFATIAVENPSRMTNRRIKETVGIRYQDAGKMNAIVKDVENMLRGHHHIDNSKTLMVHFTSFSPSSLDFFIYTFTKTTQWVTYHEIKQDVLLRVVNIIHQHGADIAYPTNTVYLEKE